MPVEAHVQTTGTGKQQARLPTCIYRGLDQVFIGFHVHNELDNL